MIVSGILCEKCFTGFAKCLLQTRHLVKPTTMMRMVCAWFQWCASFAHECTHLHLDFVAQWECLQMWLASLLVMPQQLVSAAKAVLDTVPGAWKLYEHQFRKWL